MRYGLRRVGTEIFDFHTGMASAQCMVCQGGQHVIQSAALFVAQQQAVHDAAGIPIARVCSSCIERLAHIASEGNNGRATHKKALWAARHAGGRRLWHHGLNKKVPLSSLPLGNWRDDMMRCYGWGGVCTLCDGRETLARLCPYTRHQSGQGLWCIFMFLCVFNHNSASGVPPSE